MDRRLILLSLYSLCTAGDLNTSNRSFDYNGESNLDLQYGMALVTGKQPVQLYQVGDHPIGETLRFPCEQQTKSALTAAGGSFNNFLDAIDGSYCNFQGGDDPSQDGIYPDPAPSGYNGTYSLSTY